MKKNQRKIIRMLLRRALCLTMCIYACMLSATAQTRITVKGKVVDEQNEPLAGASIIVKGTTRGVTTDLDGTFTIDVTPREELLFSYIGYEPQLLKVNTRTTFLVRLEPKKNELDEVTVVAFGKQKKESVVSSISTVNTKELRIPSSNLTTALAGRVSGLISYQRSGEPGEDDASFFIRGVTSFSYAAGPLILIDGVEMTSSDLARLQPDDIASFSIMKDAAATALYGARGGNGVILVTTKEGREGKAQFSIRYESSMSMPTQNIKLADPITYMRLNNEAVLTRNPMTSVPYAYEKIDNTIAGTNPYVYPANDWYKELFKNQTVNNRLNFNVSGGGNIARYYIAGTYLKGDNLPVENVSWHDVQVFIRKLNQQTGKNYRLPTEAEWEFAARGGNSSQGYKYSGSNTAGSVAWYDDNSGYKTHPVGTQQANELGIYDMSGNVWEWCDDLYGSYSNATQTFSTDTLPNDCVARGGGWHYGAEYVRVSCRDNYDLDGHYYDNFVGFRLALSSN